MFWSENKKNRYTPAYPSFFYIKVGFKGLYILRTCFPDIVLDSKDEKYVLGKNSKDEKYVLGKNINVYDR